MPVIETSTSARWQWPSFGSAASKIAQLLEQPGYARCGERLSFAGSGGITPAGKSWAKKSAVARMRFGQCGHRRIVPEPVEPMDAIGDAERRREFFRAGAG